MKEYIFMFDVEATELHGEGFAVGAVVAHKKSGHLIDNFQLLSLEGEQKAGPWVKENVLPALKQLPVCDTQRQLRDTFFNFYLKYKDIADFWSDVNYPVETNFLAAVVADDPEKRQWAMPYPLYDLGTILNVEFNREELIGEGDWQKHNPLHDAIISLKCLLNQPASISPGR